VTIWEVLGIDQTADERSIKRAYASKLKVTRPDDDPTAFQLLNDCFQHALAQARHSASAAPAQPVEQEIVMAPAPAPQPVIRMAHPVRTVPQDIPIKPPAGPSAAAQAATLWATFIGTSTVQPGLHLNKLANGDALLNMEVREQFELCAARYCASEACGVDLREAVVKHFQWETGYALIARALPQETRQLIAYLRAERSWAFFQQHQSSDLAVKALLAERPGCTWLQTCDASFMRKMRDLLAAIQEYHPEMLLLKLDQERFAKWEERVARKRYFVQTFLYSFIATMVLWVLFIMALLSLGTSDKWFGAAFIGAIVAGYGGLGWYAFKRPNAHRPFRESALGARLHRLLYELRYQPRWQFAWLVPFICASTLLFLPHPVPFVRYIATGTLLACVLAGSFAASAVMNLATFFVAIVFGIGMGTALSEKALAFDPPACMMAAYCFVLMLVRGGKDFVEMSLVKAGTILPLRAGWLAGVAALISGAHLPLALGMPATYATVSWLWLCAGTLLAWPSFHFIFALIGTVVAQMVVNNFAPLPSLLAVQPMTQLFAGLIFVTIFMSVNMVRARSNQHPYT
jgi:hypothetical protein